MMHIGSNVKINAGDYHGKRGTVTSTRTVTMDDGRVYILPTVTLADDSTIEVSGDRLTIVR